MPHHHHHRRRRLSGGAIAAIVAAIVVAYVGVLFGVQAVGSRIEQAGGTETMGSLDGRFTDDALTMEYNGRTWTYRERALTNILLMGIDWEDTTEDVTKRYAGQADFLLLMTLDRVNKTVTTIQLDRDTMADVRIYGPFGNYTGIQTLQLCLSHAYGSTAAENCENTVWAVSRLLGNIPIDGYIALDMSAITILNDTLGGVTVTLEDDFSHLDPSMTKGTTLTLHGQQAEYYARGRMDVGDGSNVSRMRRQRTFIAGAEELLVQGMSNNLNYVGTLFDALSDHMTTNMERGWLINKAYASQEYQRLETQTPAGSRSIGEDGFMEFHADADALGDLVTSCFFQ